MLCLAAGKMLEKKRIGNFVHWKCYCLGLKIRKYKKSTPGNLASCNLLPDCYAHELFGAFLSSSKVGVWKIEQQYVEKGCICTFMRD